MPPRTGSSRRPPQNINTANNDFITLKILYRQQLPTLCELFPGWSQEDLVATIHEANGDLELTIGRIMEGHTNQWDQVKTKKSKTQQKHIQAGDNTNLRKPDTSRDISRGAKSRNGRSRGKFGDKSQGNKNDESLKEEEKKPSWASILKGPTKPEPPVSSTQPETSDKSDKSMDPDDHIGDDRHDGNTFNITEETQQVATITMEPPTAEIDLTGDVLEQAGDNTVEIVQEQQQHDTIDDESPTKEVQPAPELQQAMTFRKVPVRRLKQDEPVVLPGGGGSGLEHVSMQFGSLNLANGEEQPITRHVEEQPITHHVEEQDTQQQDKQSEKETLTASNTPVPAPSKALSIETSTPPNPPSVTTISSQAPSDMNNHTTTSNTNVYNNQSQHPIHQQIPVQPQYNYQYHQQPSLQQQQQYSTDTAYVPYTPNPLPVNGQMQNFVNPGMTTMPDYYNSDYQRSANYYDPNVYNQSPSIDNAHVYGRGKFSNAQEPSPTLIGMMGNNTSVPQQAGMYDRNGYYSHYYMPNQYQNYQQTGYQQQQQQITSQPYQQVPQQQPVSYMNPMYGGKPNNSVYQDYTNPQVYDENGILHTNGSQGLTFDRSSSSNTVPYLGRNMNLPQPMQNVNQQNDLIMNGLDKQGQQYQGNYQPQYQDYQQQQQTYLYQQPTYRQPQQQQAQYWH
ncbi:hypothetical protein BC941DRAFT_424741 [Chlamydoabsidia padenii]|nr:hypothetical protein BC941DRAFT_424741 [Chlamydoabsidia padenii]